MGFELTSADRKKLTGVNKDLVRVIERAAQLSDRPFRVLEGLRTIQRQKQLVAKGASKTMRSRHLTGHAVDIAPLDDGEVSWAWPLYYPLAKTVKQAAAELKVPIEWGGDWSSFKDGPHWQLPWATHPARTNVPEVEAAAPMTDKTERRVSNERVATVTTGSVVATGLGAEPLAKAAEAVTTQQGEITSGSIIRIAIALAIVGLTVWAAMRAAQ